MALVDVRGFNLQPQAAPLTTGLQELAGFQQLGARNIQREKSEQIRQLLGQSGQQTPQTEQQQQLAAQTADFGGEKALAEQPQAISQEQLVQQARKIDPVLANKALKDMGLDDETKRAEASRFASQLQSAPFEQRADMITARAQSLQAQGRDPKDTIQLLDMDQAQQDQALTGVQLLDLSTKERFGVQAAAEKGAAAGTSEREFNNLIKDFSEADKIEARRVKAGIEGRATGSAIQTITKEGTALQVGESSAIIKQREKFGELTGASRAKSIDKGFDRIVKIDKGILNIDRAISALEAGAGTGAIEKFLPSFKAASVELKQIQNEMALDVIGGVTLGAISEAELDLVKLVALPEGLNEPELIKHLQDRKAAQQKLRGYFQEQINWLDKGGTVASFIRDKERQKSDGATSKAADQPAAQGKVKFLGFE